MKEGIFPGAGGLYVIDSNISDSSSSAQNQLHFQYKYVSTVLFNRHYDYKENFFLWKMCP